jgi:NADPH:quinone reductase-like Zn-dependent oxidoreductase
MASLELPSSNSSLTYTHPSTPPHLTHTPIFSLPPSSIFVKIYAAAINPVDIQLWNWAFLGYLYGSREKGIGRDYSGSIVALGSDVRKSGKWEIGDEVYGLCNRPMGEGTFAHYLEVKQGEPIAKKAKNWTHEEAAAVPLVVLTAFACLDWLPEPRKSPNGRQRRVIVSGASGGVGIWCVQLAKKLYDCHVTGICSGRNAEFVKGLGADRVVDYGTQDVVKCLLDGRPEGKKYDLYIDCVGGTKNFNHWVCGPKRSRVHANDVFQTELLHPHGAYITIVGDKTSREAMGGPATYFTYPSQVFRHVRGYLFGPRYANVLLYQKSELLEQVAQLADEGKLDVIVQDVVQGILSEEGHTEAWEKVKEYMLGGRVRGKIVVAIE